MENLPVHVALIFAAATMLTAWFLFIASGKSVKLLTIVLAWLLIQAIISLTGFYTVTDSMPPRFLLLVGPPLVSIIFLFASAKGRTFVDCLNPGTLSLLHIVRVPVEIVLFMLYMNGLVPELITFEGKNFDIFSGLTALFVYYFGYVKRSLNKKIMIAWNIVCLVLLFNVVIRAVLAVPTPFQQLAFDQPNIGVLYFPFTWLPSFVVPAVLFGHLVALRDLAKRKKQA